MCGNCTCLKCDNCIGITCKEDGCIRSKVVETSCRNLPESFSHIIFAFRDLLERSGMVKPCQAMSSHVKPCQFAQEGNLRVVHMLLQQKALPSGFHWGSKGTRAPRKISVGTHGNSWELMGSVKQGQSSAFCGICVIPSLKILYPISSYL